MQTVKALSREDYEMGQFAEHNRGYKQTNIKTAHIWGIYFPLMELIGNICVVVLLAFGGWLVIQEEMLLGELVAFFSLVWYIVGPLMHLGFILNTYSQSKAAGERLLEILDEKEKIPVAFEAIKVDRLQGGVAIYRCLPPI